MIAAKPPASPLAQMRERNRINHSLPAVRRKLIEGTSRGARPSIVLGGEDARQLGDAGNLDRDSGERPWRGPIRAGMWSAAVIGTHPVEDNQRVWLEILADDLDLGRIPAYWIENKAGNSFWHAPIPPQAVGVRLHYRSVAEHAGAEIAYSTYQDSIVRPNLPDRTESPDLLGATAEGLVGNRMMTVRIDGRGSTYDIYFPTVGLHSNVRPKEGDLPQSRSHFRAIVGGLAIGRRLDWFTERAAWESFQNYSGVTNLLTTELTWRHGPIRVLITDFVVMGDSLPKNAGQGEVAGPVHQAVPDHQRGDGAAPGHDRRLRAGRDQRRGRRHRAELARPGPGSAGDQPRARPFQPQARLATRPSSSRWRSTPGATSIASRPVRMRPSSTDGSSCRPASRCRSTCWSAARSPAGAAIAARSSTGCGRPSPGSDRPILT